MKRNEKRMLLKKLRKDKIIDKKYKPSNGNCFENCFQFLMNRPALYDRSNILHCVVTSESQGRFVHAVIMFIKEQQFGPPVPSVYDVFTGSESTLEEYEHEWNLELPFHYNYLQALRNYSASGNCFGPWNDEHIRIVMEFNE